VAEWFVPKRYGIGVGLPIAWQGWALTFGYLAIVLGSCLLLREILLALLAILVSTTVAFLIISMKTTRGGWRWRWGETE
jgi:hypothetical protein